MKKIIFTLLIISAFDCLLFNTESFSQSNWMIQSPLPTRYNISDIRFINQNIGYACGTLVTVIKTTNGGFNWFNLNTGIPTNNDGAYTYSLFFNNELTGYVASSRRIIKTTNGGENWTIIDTGSFSIKGKIFFTDYNTGYIVGSNIIRKTTNAGLNWTKQTLPNYYFYSCYFINSLTGYISGNLFGLYGIIGKTISGGNNWGFDTINFGGTNIESINFIDENTGYAAGNNYLVIKTSNGGLNWINHDANAGLNLHSVCFINSQTGVVVGNSISKTSDGGNTWFAFDIGSQRQLNCIYLLDTFSGYTAGNAGLIMKTTDEGNAWYTTSSGTGDEITSLFFLNEKTGFATAHGLDGDIIKTTNGGINWITISKNFLPGIINSTCFINDTTGFVTDENGILFKTTNNGKNWTQLNLNRTLHKITFVNNTTGYISSDNSVLKSTDGGNMWVLQSIVVNSSFVSILFRDENYGFIAGTNGCIMKTSNGGINWVQNNSGITNDIISIDFPTDLNGFAITSNKILKTTNGGDNWNIINSGLMYSLKCVKFTNENTGYISGGESDLYSLISKTTNGGLNWISVNPPTNNCMNVIFVINPDTIYSGGFLGSIVKTSNGGIVWIIHNETNIPINYRLYQNYPNPFNPVTKIKFDLIIVGQTFLYVYDVLGKKVATLVNEKLNPGSYEITFDGSDLSNGVYFYQLKTEDFVESRKMLLLK